MLTLAQENLACVKYDVFAALRDSECFAPSQKLLFFMSRQTDDKIVVYHALREKDSLYSPYIDNIFSYASKPLQKEKMTSLHQSYFGVDTVSPDNKHFFTQLKIFPERKLELHLKKSGNVTVTSVFYPTVTIITADGKEEHVQLPFPRAEIYNVHTMEKITATNVDVSEICIYGRVTAAELQQAIIATNKKFAGKKWKNMPENPNAFVCLVEHLPITPEMRSRFSASEYLQNLMKNQDASESKN